MPPAVILGAVSAASAIGSAFAKGNAAEDRAEEARRQQGLAIDAAKITPFELSEIDAQIKDSERVLSRERKLIEAVDPTLIEASNQAFQLLKGKEAAVLGPLRRQRERQRSVLRNSLRQSLGSAFEQSSAGIEALNKFDSSTSDLLVNAQQSTTMQLLGITSRTAQTARSSEAAAGRRRGQASQIFQNAKAREVNAITGTAAGTIQGAGAANEALAGTLGTISSFASFGSKKLGGGGGGDDDGSDELGNFVGGASAAFSGFA